MSTESEVPAYRHAADAIAEAQDADVLLVNGAIYRPLALTVLDLCHSRRRRKNVILILVTHGGDAGAAYKLARCLQSSYEHFTLYLTGSCKSAGTLVALGAHDLVVGHKGEMGPLDVQMSKPDELMQRQSGLTATAALSTLHEKAFDSFEHFFINLVRRSNSTLSTRTATHVAVQLTTGLFAPLFEHIDPMHVGEAGRALQVASQYGEILQAESENLMPDALDRLTSGFASHDFVIDLAQIETLFRVVRQPNAMEIALAEALGPAATDPSVRGELVAYISTEDREAREQELPGMAETGNNDEQASHAAHPATGNGERPSQGDSGEKPEAPSHPHLAAVEPIGRTGTE